MSAAEKVSPPPVRLASTVLLLRDGAQGLEVFMVVRHQEIDFASGALVFPGGKLAAGDHDPCLAACCSGAAGLTPEQLALRIAAVRETFEECGVLLARGRGETDLLGPERLHELGARWRQPLDRGEAGMAELLQSEDLELAIEALVPFAHWITPAFMPKRFDTWFFLAAAPPQQIALHDGREMVDSLWLRPADALAQAAAGQHTLVPVTQMNVAKLGFSGSVAEAVTAANAAPIVTVEPDCTPQAGGMLLRIPSEAGYRVDEFFMPVPGR